MALKLTNQNKNTIKYKIHSLVEIFCFSNERTKINFKSYLSFKRYSLFWNSIIAPYNVNGSQRQVINSDNDVATYATFSGTEQTRLSLLHITPNILCIKL
jgi:hypothetical protein